MKIYAGEDVELGKHSSIAGWSTNNDFGNQYGDFSENRESIYLKTQQYHSWAYIQMVHTYTDVQLIKAQGLKNRKAKHPATGSYLDLRPKTVILSLRISE